MLNRPLNHPYLIYRNHIIDQDQPAGRCSVRDRSPERNRLTVAVNTKAAMGWIDQRMPAH